MKPRLSFTILLIVLSYLLFAQNPYLVLTYTAEDNGTYEQLDSIKIMNRSQDCDTVLFWPDTVLVLGSNVGLNEITNSGSGLQVYQNYPNPIIDRTTFELYVPEQDIVTFIAIDIAGRTVLNTSRILEEGMHAFEYTPAQAGIAFLSVLWREELSTIRVVSSSQSSGNHATLNYSGKVTDHKRMKTFSMKQNFMFAFGDTLLYIGYNDTLESGILQAPMTHDTSSFQFAYNIPCPSTPTVTYEGQVYNTVQIFSQCWLKENLNVGTMIPGTEEMTDNGILEKYCYNNETDSCTKYGGLYQWWEMMQYTTQHGVQGVCPPGWHLPTDEEWKVLEGAVDSQYGIGDPEWDISWYFRGYDAGTNLKATSGWYNNGNGTDLFGFSGLPGGNSCYDGVFSSVGLHGYWWASSENYDSSAWYRLLIYGYPGVGRGIGYQGDGFSVRCLRDY